MKHLKLALYALAIFFVYFCAVKKVYYARVLVSNNTQILGNRNEVFVLTGKDYFGLETTLVELLYNSIVLRHTTKILGHEMLVSVISGTGLKQFPVKGLELSSTAFPYENALYYPAAKKRLEDGYVFLKWNENSKFVEANDKLLESGLKSKGVDKSWFQMDGLEFYKTSSAKFKIGAKDYTIENRVRKLAGETLLDRKSGAFVTTIWLVSSKQENRIVEQDEGWHSISSEQFAHFADQAE